ncbi:MAG: 5'-nucleotidase C-terminal domain-containing protein, partial [Bacilli bacterium]
SFSKTAEAPRMMAKAMYEYAQEQGHDVVLGMVNQARANLPAGDVTYTDLFASFPFSNRTVIMNVKGSDLRRNSGAYYFAPTPFSYSDNQTYLIAVYDYLAYHQNSRREYDYFLNRDVVASLSKYPVDLIYDYMKEQTGTIMASSYMGTSFSFL